jgi:hypothetical protein
MFFKVDFYSENMSINSRNIEYDLRINLLVQEVFGSIVLKYGLDGTFAV